MSTEPVLEDDVVERLKYLASGSQLWEAGELSGIFRQSFTLIERLQKELGEARDENEKLQNRVWDLDKALWDAVAAMNNAVPEARTVVSRLEEAAARAYRVADPKQPDEIAKAIRSIDGGGK